MTIKLLSHDVSYECLIVEWKNFPVRTGTFELSALLDAYFHLKNSLQ